MTDDADLIRELRHWNPVTFPLTGRAADEIERLRHDLARAVENHTADLARLAEAEALRKDAERWRELESVGRQYRFPSIWGGTVWRDSSNDYNGSRYTETREIFARREAIDAAMGEKP